MRAPSSIALAASLWLLGADAFATHPDHEGERGFELTLQPGLGIFTSSDDRVFLPATDFTGMNVPQSAFGSTGFAFRASLGYRIMPLFSAGVAVGFQPVSPTGEFSNAERQQSPTDTLSNAAFGLYTRFYFLSLINGARETPRVFFQGAADPRRFEAYFTLGVDFISGLRRQRTYADPQDLVIWRTSYIGVPIGVGGEYRVTTSLAFGLSVLVTPLVGASTNKTVNDHTNTGSLDQTMVTESTYSPASGNAQVFVGLSARYTLTLF